VATERAERQERQRQRRLRAREVSRELSQLEVLGAAAGAVVIDVPSPSAAEARRSPSPRAAAARRLAQLRRDEAAAEAGRGSPAVDLSDVV
jgi:hypothetical protein